MTSKLVLTSDACPTQFWPKPKHRSKSVREGSRVEPRVPQPLFWCLTLWLPWQDGNQLRRVVIVIRRPWTFCDTYNALYGDFVFGPATPRPPRPPPPAKRTQCSRRTTQGRIYGPSPPPQSEDKSTQHCPQSLPCLRVPRLSGRKRLTVPTSCQQ